MKIDAETMKKQVILHLPYVLFLLVFAKLGEAVRLAPGADASQKLLGLSEGFALAFQSMWPGAVSYTHLDVYKRQQCVFGLAELHSLAAQQNASCRFMKPVRRLSARLPAGSYRQMGGID